MLFNNLAGKEKMGIVLIDMQEKFVEALPNLETLMKNQLQFIDKNRGKPIIALEMNPRTYGSTIEPIKTIITTHPRNKIITKIFDNGFKSEEFKDALTKLNLDTLALLGCNTSWCVWATAKSAKTQGYNLKTSTKLISEPKYFKTTYPGRLKESLRWYYDNCNLLN